MMPSSVDGKDYKMMQECYVIVASLFKIAVIFTGLGFYGIAKMQQYLYSVIEHDYSIEVLLNSAYKELLTKLSTVNTLISLLSFLVSHMSKRLITKEHIATHTHNKLFTSAH